MFVLFIYSELFRLVLVENIKDKRQEVQQEEDRNEEEVKKRNLVF